MVGRMKTVKLTPEVFEDARGKISTFYPADAIVEYNLLETKQGDHRGYHYHPHFDEYMLVVDGCCRFSEHDGVTESINLNTGDSLYIPSGVAHSFVAITDLKFISLLTQRWNDSIPPIVKISDDQPI
jgi:quercetin dioxygenase-like cupin family protein